MKTYEHPTLGLMVRVSTVLDKVPTKARTALTEWAEKAQRDHSEVQP